jgi:hypothetical protein
MTQRYVHPQDEAIGRVFATLAKKAKVGTKKQPSRSGVGTKKGTNTKREKIALVKA